MKHSSCLVTFVTFCTCCTIAGPFKYIKLQWRTQICFRGREKKEKQVRKAPHVREGHQRAESCEVYMVKRVHFRPCCNIHQWQRKMNEVKHPNVVQCGLLAALVTEEAKNFIFMFLNIVAEGCKLLIITTLCRLNRGKAKHLFHSLFLYLSQ